MPEVYVLYAVDGRGRVLTEAWFIGDPPEFSSYRSGEPSPFERTVSRYFGDQPRLRMGIVLACRGCGCTDDHPCEGGCEWVDFDDLCSRCAAPGIVTP